MTVYQIHCFLFILGAFSAYTTAKVFSVPLRILVNENQPEVPPVENSAALQGNRPIEETIRESPAEVPLESLVQNPGEAPDQNPLEDSAKVQVTTLADLPLHNATNVAQPFPKLMPVPEHCGKGRYQAQHRTIHQRLVKRIVGGQESFDGEWPWLVTMRLLRNGSDGYEHLCGGTLIAPGWIITAAHCFESVWADYLTDDTTKWMARIGEHNMFVDQANHVDVSPEKIIIHPDRRAPERLNVDVALVKLSHPVSLNDRVNVACLPRSDDEFLVGTTCVTAGWGHTKEDGNVSYVSQHVYVPIMSNARCNSLYDALSPQIDLTITDDMMCAGLEEGGKDACQYDSGGPMVCFDATDDQWLLAGIVSTGYGCARPGFPGIYTRVNKFVPWIKNTIATN